MRKGGLIALCLAAVLVFSGCKDNGLVVQGGSLAITPEDLQFEVYKLGPSYKFEDTYESRFDLVKNLAARHFLAEESNARGYGEEGLADEVRTAESTALSEAYSKWKIAGRVRVPRVESMQVLGKLNRKIHVKQLLFAVYPIAVDARAELKAGESFDSLAAGLAGREDVTLADLDWKAWKDFDRNVATVLFDLEPGQSTEVIRSPAGYCIFYLAEDQPGDADQRLILLRSKRFVRWLQEAALTEEMRKELAERFHVRYSDKGLADALRSFAISFRGEMPPEDLLSTNLVTYEVKGKPVAYSVGYIFNYYWNLPGGSQPYVGDLHGIEQCVLDALVTELQAAAGSELGLDRTRDVVWGVKKAREEFLIPKMEDFFRGQVQVSDGEVAAYYDSHRGELQTRMTYRVRRILVKTQSDADAVLIDLRAGKDFAQLAMEKSIDANSAPKGGDLGYVEVGMFAQYDSIAQALQPGEISGPLSTSSGVEIVKIEQKEAARSLTADEARGYVRQTLEETKANDLLQRWVTDKESSVGYWVNTDLLRTLELPEPAWKAMIAKEVDESEGSAETPTTPSKVPMGRKARERARRG